MNSSIISYQTRFENAIDFFEHLQRFCQVVHGDNTGYEVECVRFERKTWIFVQVSNYKLVDLFVLRELVLIHSHSDGLFELHILVSVVVLYQVS